jgi:hypothetical protein
MEHPALPNYYLNWLRRVDLNRRSSSYEPEGAALAGAIGAVVVEGLASGSTDLRLA